jgi:phosphatidylinositol alpha-1,6-mannosyltransferase
VEYWPDEISVIDNRENKLLGKHLPFLKWLTAVRTILNTVKNLKPDWFIAGEVLPIGTALYLAGRFKKLRYAVILHGLDSSLATAFFWKRALCKRVLQNASIIFCANSKTLKDVQLFLGDSQKIVLANPGVDQVMPNIRIELQNGLRTNYGLEKAFVMTSIGRLVKRKGVDAVISALPEIIKRIPNIRYAIIGDGPEESALRHAVSELKLEQYVIFLTKITDEIKWAWLSVSDIFIMAARQIKGDYEGFGIVYLEANLFSKPVISGKSGGVVDAVVDGVNGLMVDENSPEAIAQAVIRLAEDAELRKRLGESGKQRVLKEFFWKDKVIRMYEKLKSNL